MIFMDTALLFTCQSILVTGVTTPESCASFVSFGLYRSGRLHKSGVPSGSCEPPWPEFSLQKFMINSKSAEFTWSSPDLQICVIAVSLLKDKYSNFLWNCIFLGSNSLGLCEWSD